MPLDPALLDRFHQTLVDEIRRSRPEYLKHTFTVGEIYQDLIPYRTHRDAIGVGINGDYEDALLRLLGGQGDYLILESARAKSEILKELESNNPNTSLFRDFASVDVRLNPTSIDGSSTESAVADVEADSSGDEVGEGTARVDDPEDEAGNDPSQPLDDQADGDTALATTAEDDSPGDLPVDARADETSEEAVDSDDEALAEVAEADAVRDEADEDDIDPETPSPDDAASDVEPETSAADDEDSPDERRVWEMSTPDTDDQETTTVESTGAETSMELDTHPAPGEACGWCQETLPDREGLNYCPHCGANLGLTPCAECGEPLEAAWRYCVACGSEAASG